MPQVSLYLDAKTLKTFETKAKARNMSISKYLKELIQKDVQSNWPKDYFTLFGSIKDPTFQQIS